ncbi:MAG: isochorismatase [Cyanobacteria bacterium P01_B01_bin.77]
MNHDAKKSALLTAVHEASARWQKAFNIGDAAGCTAQYESTATVQAMPLGSYSGHEQIQAFWQQLMNDGFADVEYIEPKIEVLDETTAVLTSKWKMNKAYGMIHRELWALQVDGTAKLREDIFEVQG